MESPSKRGVLSQVGDSLIYKLSGVQGGMRSLLVAGRCLQHFIRNQDKSLLHTDLRAAFAELISIKEAAFCLHTIERQGVWPTPLDQAQDKAHLHAAKESLPSKVSGPRIASLVVIGSQAKQNIRLQFFQTAGCALQIVADNAWPPISFTYRQIADLPSISQVVVFLTEKRICG